MTAIRRWGCCGGRGRQRRNLGRTPRGEHSTTCRERLLTMLTMLYFRQPGDGRGHRAAVAAHLMPRSANCGPVSLVTLVTFPSHTSNHRGIDKGGKRQKVQQCRATATPPNTSKHRRRHDDMGLASWPPPLGRRPITTQRRSAPLRTVPLRYCIGFRQRLVAIAMVVRMVVPSRVALSQ